MKGVGRASTSHSHSPITGGEGDDDGWVEDRYYSPIHSDAWVDMSGANDATWFLSTFCATRTIFFDYAYYQREEMRNKCMYTWSGVGVEDIAHYLGIVMWMGIIGLPEMRMYWAHNMTFSLIRISTDNAQEMF